MRRFVSSGLVVLAGFVAPAAVEAPSHVVAFDIYKGDPRAQRIQEFFMERGCPAQEHAEHFVLAAEQNRLDWRLLPSLALVECGGGRTCGDNGNLFGWANGEMDFPSTRAAIHHVARRLAHSSIYKGRSLDAKLRLYNRRPEYSQAVKRVMAQLGPALLN